MKRGVTRLIRNCKVGRAIDCRAEKALVLLFMVSALSDYQNEFLNLCCVKPYESSTIDNS